MSPLATDEIVKESELFKKQFGKPGNHAFKLKDRHEFIADGGAL